MRLATIATADGPRPAALLGADRIVDLRAAAGWRGGQIDASLTSMQTLIEAGERGQTMVRGLLVDPPAVSVSPLSAVRLMSPLPRPIGLRECALFLQHMEAGLDRMARREAADEADSETAYLRLIASGRFSPHPILKSEVLYGNYDALAVSGPGDDIYRPSDSAWLDFEFEWACVVGRGGRNVPADRARAHILGFMIFNDWSARDTQFRLMSTGFGPGRGKDFAGANTLGPWITTQDEIGDPYDLAMRCEVNGQTWSTGSTADMHHRFEDAIVQFSRERTLHAGEILCSGTMLGGCGFDLDRRLCPGDVVTLEVEGLGRLSNRVLWPDGLSEDAAAVGDQGAAGHPR